MSVSEWTLSWLRFHGAIAAILAVVVLLNPNFSTTNENLLMIFAVPMFTVPIAIVNFFVAVFGYDWLARRSPSTSRRRAVMLTTWCLIAIGVVGGYYLTLNIVSQMHLSKPAEVVVRAKRIP